MQALRTRPGTRRGGIVYLRTGDIYPNPVQPRKQFDSGALEELSLSIKITVFSTRSPYAAAAGAMSLLRESGGCARQSSRGSTRFRA